MTHSQERTVPHNKVALACMAHPDDVEFTCGGTLALLHERGWEIHIATMTPGDCGSEQLSREEISRIRRIEGANAAAVLSGKFHCLECQDGFIAYDRPTITATVRLIREVRPSVVFAAAPHDYLIDHEVSSALVRNAAFFAGVPNLKTEGVGPFRPVPLSVLCRSCRGQRCVGSACRSEDGRRHERRHGDKGSHAGLPRQPARVALEAAWNG